MTSALDNLARLGAAAIEGAAEAGALYIKKHGGIGDLSGGGRSERFVLDLRTNRDPDPDPKAITPDPKVITPAPDPEPQPQPLVEPSPLVQAADAALEPAVQEPQLLDFDPHKGAISPDHAPLVVQTDAVIVDPSAPLPGARAQTVRLDVLELTGRREDPGFFANAINGLANLINQLFGLPPSSPENSARVGANFWLGQRGIPLHIGHDGIVHLTDDAAGGSMLAPLLMELNRPGSLDPAGYSALPNLPSRDLLASAGFSEDFISGFEASVDNIRRDAAVAAAVGIGFSMIGAAAQIGSGNTPHLQGEGTVYTGARQGQLPGTAEGRPQIELRFNPATGTFERVVVPPQPGGVVTQPGSGATPPPSQYGPGSLIPTASGVFVFNPSTPPPPQTGPSVRDVLILSIQQQDPAAAQRLNAELQALRPRDNAPSVDQRINPNLGQLLNPQQFLQNNSTVTNSPLMQSIMDRYAGDLQTPEDVARMAVSGLIDRNTGLMTGDAIPLVLGSQGGGGPNRIEYMEFSGLKPTNTIDHELGNDLIGLGAEEIRRQLESFAPERFGQDLNLFYAGGTGFFITGPDSLVLDATRHLREGFRNVRFGTAETPEPSVYTPALVSETVGIFGPIAHEPGFGTLLNDLYALVRGRIDQTKLDDPDYPNRTDPLYETPENPEALTDVRIIEGSQVIAEQHGRTRSPATERLREGFPGLVEEIGALSPEEFALYRDQVLSLTYGHRIYPQLGNNRTELEAIRDENGVVLPNQGMFIADLRRMRDLNNLPIVSNPEAGINTWAIGNQALANYQRALAEAAIIWPDLIVTQPGFGDEAAILGPSEDVQAAMVYIRERLAETVITIPDPRDPTRSVSVHGVGVQFGYGDIAEDGTMPDSQLLEARSERDKAVQNFRFHVTDQDGNVIFSERSPE
ncbi:MAG: hypothetical protein ACXIVE_10030 [Salinarimonas sp.]